MTFQIFKYGIQLIFEQLSLIQLGKSEKLISWGEGPNKNRTGEGVGNFIKKINGGRIFETKEWMLQGSEISIAFSLFP